ncbi:MAG: ABC transporter substrate-binding protein [Solirubrobacteraceae bacterium]
MKRFQWLMALAAVCMLLAACGGTSSSGGSSSTSSKATAVSGGKVAGKLVVDNESGSTWTCQFNPFNPAVTLVSFGWVYEPLEYVNILKTGSTTPWLASSSQWSSDFKTLTFTIRNGAKWSDGQPFTADDVAYTFNAMKSDKAIDLNAIWKADGGPLTNVALKGNQVVLTFDGPSQPYFYLVADQTPIVPKHIWSTLNQSKLHSYSDTHPVGTGPYLVSNCAPQNIKYLNNPNYWQSTSGHPVPAVKEVDYPAFLSNTSANLVLSQGGAQWGGQYIPNIQTFYISKDPAHRHYWFAPVLNVSLFPNLTNSVLSQLPVRQAISLAIDRATVSRLGESGYQAPANQTGVVLPTFSSWSDSSLAQTTYSPSKAEQTLTSAGFTKGSDGIYKDKSGNPLAFTIKTISGYSDWDSSLQLITQQLKAVGIKVTVQDENTTSYTTDLQSGHFDLAYGGSGGPAPSPGPSPYYELRGLLFSGTIGSTNYERFKSPSTDALFNQYSSASPSQQIAIIHDIQKVMVDQVPLIPVTEGVDWYQYDTSHFAGWPTQSNPYAQPSPYQAPDMGVVLTHLVPTG